MPRQLSGCHAPRHYTSDSPESVLEDIGHAPRGLLTNLCSRAFPTGGVLAIVRCQIDRQTLHSERRCKFNDILSIGFENWTSDLLGN